MPTWFRKIRRTLSWHRRAVAACCAAIAMVALIIALRPPATPTVPVVVTAEGLPGGHRLEQDDLSVAQWPTGLVPGDAVAEPAQLVGRTLTAPLSSGSAVTAVSVISDRTEIAPGMVIAPVRVADPELISLLRAGDRIDVLGMSENGQMGVIAGSVRLISVPAPDQNAAGLAPASSSAALILVEAPAQTALRIAESSTAGPLAVVLR